jgi:hypothetical protein
MTPKGLELPPLQPGTRCHHPATVNVARSLSTANLRRRRWAGGVEECPRLLGVGDCTVSVRSRHCLPERVHGPGGFGRVRRPNIRVAIGVIQVGVEAGFGPSRLCLGDPAAEGRAMESPRRRFMLRGWLVAVALLGVIVAGII